MDRGPFANGLGFAGASLLDGLEENLGPHVIHHWVGTIGLFPEQFHMESGKFLDSLPNFGLTSMEVNPIKPTPSNIIPERLAEVLQAPSPPVVRAIL